VFPSLRVHRSYEPLALDGGDSQRAGSAVAAAAKLNCRECRRNEGFVGDTRRNRVVRRRLLYLALINGAMVERTDVPRAKKRSGHLMRWLV
jgi:hypothetical protein